MSRQRTAERHRLEWQGRKIVIDYHPHSYAGCAQIEVRAKNDRPVPITRTGYRSCFLAREDVEREGGPVAYIAAWLDSAAQTKQWRRIEKSGLQLTLF